MKRKMGATFLALVPLLTVSSVTQAQNASVFVAAKTGNDAHSCGDVRTPCKTFAGAITQVDAGGEIIVIESGDYGPVTINKAVTINASGVEAFIHYSYCCGNAITINAGATDTVVLRGLTLNGATRSGIAASSVGQLFVEHCTIAGYLVGVYFVAPGATLVMRDDDVRRCPGTGVLVEPPAGAGATVRAVIRDCVFADDGNGVAAESGAVVTVVHSVAADSFNAGFVVHALTAANADMSLDGVQAVSNRTGLEAASLGGSGTATIRFVNSLVTQNMTGVHIGLGGTILGSSPGTSVIAGNGTDINGSLGAAIPLQ